MCKSIDSYIIGQKDIQIDKSRQNKSGKKTLNQQTKTKKKGGPDSAIGGKKGEGSWMNQKKIKQIYGMYQVLGLLQFRMGVLSYSTFS